nr:MAG TPA: hypothetical protein [Caudoviricetes sp.]
MQQKIQFFLSLKGISNNIGTKPRRFLKVSIAG